MEQLDSDTDLQDSYTDLLENDTDVSCREIMIQTHHEVIHSDTCKDTDIIYAANGDAIYVETPKTDTNNKYSDDDMHLGYLAHFIVRVFRSLLTKQFLNTVSPFHTFLGFTRYTLGQPVSVSVKFSFLVSFARKFPGPY